MIYGTICALLLKHSFSIIINANMIYQLFCFRQTSVAVTCIVQFLQNYLCQILFAWSHTVQREISSLEQHWCENSKINTNQYIWFKNRNDICKVHTKYQEYSIMQELFCKTLMCIFKIYANLQCKKMTRVYKLNNINNL